MCTYTALSVTLSRTAKSIVESHVHFPESIFIHITNSYNIYSYCILEILIGFVYIIVFYYGPSSRKYHREGFFLNHWTAILVYEVFIYHSSRVGRAFDL